MELLGYIVYGVGLLAFTLWAMRNADKYGKFLMGEILHFIKHFLGLCGEAHPSVLVSGGALITWISVYYKQLLEYVRSMF